MDKEFEKVYMEQHDREMTWRIHKLVFFAILIAPVFYILTKLGIFHMTYRGIIMYMVYTGGTWLFVEVLLRFKCYIVTKYLQLLFLTLLIAAISSDANFGIYLTYFAIPLVSCVYFDWTLTLLISIAGYVGMIGFLYPRAIKIVELNKVNVADAFTYFESIGIGYSIEYIFMMSFAIMVVYHGREIRKNYFETQKDKLSAESASVAKTSFLANMSHEIRTPINAIIGMNEMILRESREKTIVHYADNIKNASKNLLALINDVLDFSKVESGKMEIVEAAYQTSSMLNDLVNMIQPRINERGLNFKLDIDEQIPCELYGDEVRIRQVVTNLLTNAAKYTEQGSVTLKMRCTRLPKENVIRLDVAVIDTGIGIRKADQEQLFQTFQRVDMQKNHKVEGTGLGLALSKQLLELMGSRLLLDSEYGRGSAFFFGIEQKIVDDSPIGDYKKMYERSLINSTRYHETFQAPNARILVVDDTRMNLEVCRGLLKKTRIQIDTADSGMECLNMIMRQQYHIIFLDHKMPGMDGVECLQRMRERGILEGSGTRVIALTANAVSGAREFYMERGFDDYLSKPIQGEKLEEIICQYLPPQLLCIPKTEEMDEEVENVSMPAIDGINIEDAMRFAGGDQLSYINTLRLYYDEYETKHDKLKTFFEERNAAEYQIVVHSVKSTSKQIGANDLSEQARILEEAADNGTLFERAVLHVEMLEKFDALCGQIKEVLAAFEEEKEGTELLPVTPEQLREFCKSLQESVYAYDIEEIQQKIHALCTYDYLADIKNSIQKAADDFDYDAVTDELIRLEQLLPKEC
ncbi:MAG: response regulator [bacterium]|nr:response regulator [bacterium]